ncbi:MAG: hypothetical protein JWM27_3570 [Gemmatimonadetes bacterium]|nr:hypothetical protein [Gemmatimonadota bacterium]
MPHTTFRPLLAAAAGLSLALAAPLPATLAAQADSLPGLNSLKPSSAPAFVLLGAAPSEVARPTTPTDVGLSLARAAKSLGTVPQDYALEASPYWLRGHANLTWRADSARTLRQSLARTLAFSVASAELGAVDSAAGTPVRTGVAFGLRTMLMSGHYSAATVSALHALEIATGREGAVHEKYAAAQNAADEAWVAAQVAAIGAMTDAAQKQAAMVAFRAENSARINRRDDAVLANPAYQAEVAALRRPFQNLSMKREGSMLEVSAGASWAFPGRVWQAGRMDRVGAWATYSCESCLVAGGTVPITPLATVRFYHQGGGEPDVLDAGGRLILAGGRFDLSAEGVVRSFLGAGAPKALYRVAGIFDYQVQENLWLLSTFGRDYRSATEGSLIAQLGVKFNFARQRYKAP